MPAYPCCCQKPESCAEVCAEVTLTGVDYSIDTTTADPPVEGGDATENDRLVDCAFHQRWHVPPVEGWEWEWDFGSHVPGHDWGEPGVDLHECACRWSRTDGAAVQGCTHSYHHYLYTYAQECPECEGLGCEACDDTGLTGQWMLCLVIVVDGLYAGTRVDIVFEKQLTAVMEQCPDCEGEGCEACGDTGEVVSEQTRCWWKKSLTHQLAWRCTVAPYLGDVPLDVPDFSGATATVRGRQQTAGVLQSGATCGDEPILAVAQGSGTIYRPAYCTTDADEWLSFVRLEIAGIKSYVTRAQNPGFVRSIDQAFGEENDQWAILTGEWPAYGWLTTRTSDSAGVLLGNQAYFDKLPRDPKTVTIYWWSSLGSPEEPYPEEPCTDPRTSSGFERVGRRTGCKITSAPGLPTITFSGGAGDALPAAQLTQPTSQVFRIVPEGADRFDPDYYSEETRQHEYTQLATDDWTLGVAQNSVFERGQCLAWLPLAGIFMLDPPKVWQSNFYDHDCNTYYTVQEHPAAPDRQIRLDAVQEIREVTGAWTLGWSVHLYIDPFGIASWVDWWGYAASDCCPVDLAVTRYWTVAGSWEPQDHWRFAAGSVVLDCLQVAVPPGAAAALAGQANHTAVAAWPGSAYAVLAGQANHTAVAAHVAAASAALAGSANHAAAAGTHAAAHAALAGQANHAAVGD